jgi:PAS domain S-box-containing protein
MVVSVKAVEQERAVIGKEQIESLGELLADLGVAACLVDRGLRIAWSNRLIGSGCADLAVNDGGHCFAVHWSRASRCADCLPILVFETGEPREGYRERQRPGERRRVYRVRALAVRGERGEVSHVLETLVDVTDLALRVSDTLLDARLSSGLDAAGQGVYVVDPKGRIVSWSPGMTSILGHEVDEILGRHLRLLDPRHRRPDLQSDQGRRVEAEFLAKDGRLVPVALTRTAIRDERGEVCGHQTIVEDRSEIARLRKELQLGERALAEIVRASADAIFSTDASGRVTAWNRGATLVLGYQAEEARDLDLAELLGDDAAASGLLRQARVDPAPHGLRCPLHTRAGERVLMEMSASRTPPAASWASPSSAGTSGSESDWSSR